MSEPYEPITPEKQYEQEMDELEYRLAKSFVSAALTDYAREKPDLPPETREHLRTYGEFILVQWQRSLRRPLGALGDMTVQSFTEAAAIANQRSEQNEEDET